MASWITSWMTSWMTLSIFFSNVGFSVVVFVLDFLSKVPFGSVPACHHYAAWGDERAWHHLILEE